MDLGAHDAHWHGFRLDRRHLVSPDRQKITRERLEGLLWRDAMELRLAGYASRRQAEAGRLRDASGPRVRVVVIDLADYRENGVAAA